MAATLNGSILLSVALEHRNALDLGTASDDLKTTPFKWAITSGTGANQADILWHDQRTLTASSSEDLDLRGSLTTAFGGSVANARVKGIIIKAASANTNNVLVGGASATQFVNWVSDATDVVVVRPGGCFMLMAPDATAYAVTAGTGDLLKIANSAGSTSVTYDIIVIGASA